MSQHVIEDDQYRWLVGWDPPLLTYFMQKHDKAVDPDDNPVVWLGARPAEIYEVEDLVRSAKKHGLDIPVETARALYLDKDEGR